MSDHPTARQAPCDAIVCHISEFNQMLTAGCLEHTADAQSSLRC